MTLALVGVVTVGTVTGVTLLEAPEAAPVPSSLGFDLVFAPEDRIAAADCDAMVTREFALIGESGTDEMKEGAAKTTPAEAIAKCRVAPAPKAVADCLRTATTATAMFRECYTIPFQGRDLTTVVQQIFAQYPDPPDLAPREYDVHDRHAARRAIAGKLRRVR